MNTLEVTIEKLNKLFTEWCLFCLHEPSIFKKYSGDNIYDCMIDIFDSKNELLVSNVSLIQVVFIYLQNHISLTINMLDDIMLADTFYKMLSDNMRDLHISVFYVPVALEDKKTSSRTYAIVEVPERLWHDSITKNVSTELTTNGLLILSTDKNNQFYTNMDVFIIELASLYSRLLLTQEIVYDASLSD